MWDEIRRLFAKTRESRVRGFKASRFSFQSREGRCPQCKGRGTIRVEMHFLPDVEIECPLCRGARFNRQTLSAKFRGKSVADVLSMPVSEAAEFFQNFHRLSAMLSTFAEVGLGYLLLGQSARTLSGGEAQRVKLATELCQPDPKPTLFVLDEPTLGLHPLDVERLIQLLRKLVDSGQTVVVVEHHVEVMASADWIIDLGPEGGAQGGEILAEGPPEKIADEESATGMALRGR
jgi:excinuclease ABC subunit A